MFESYFFWVKNSSLITSIFQYFKVYSVALLYSSLHILKRNVIYSLPLFIHIMSFFLWLFKVLLFLTVVSNFILRFDVFFIFLVLLVTMDSWFSPFGGNFHLLPFHKCFFSVFPTPNPCHCEKEQEFLYFFSSNLNKITILKQSEERRKYDPSLLTCFLEAG